MSRLDAAMRASTPWRLLLPNPTANAQPTDTRPAAAAAAAAAATTLYGNRQKSGGRDAKGDAPLMVFKQNNSSSSSSKSKAAPEAKAAAPVEPAAAVKAAAEAAKAAAAKAAAAKAAAAKQQQSSISSHSDPEFTFKSLSRGEDLLQSSAKDLLISKPHRHARLSLQVSLHLLCQFFYRHPRSSQHPVGQTLRPVLQQRCSSSSSDSSSSRVRQQNGTPIAEQA
ncbi:hypothetical protein Emag_002888 [Eimeria magna]